MPKGKKRKKKKDTPLSAKGRTEYIEEYTEYADILKEDVPLSVDSSDEPLMKDIKYLGTVSRFIIKGPITGQRYVFTTKERIRAVAIEDYEDLLQRVRAAHKCCGSKRMIAEQPYFGPV